MLALACAARHPQAQSGVVLVGCGTFDPVARSACEQTLRERMGQGLRTELRSLPGSIPDPDQRLAAMGRLLMPVYSHELVEDHDVCEPVCDARAHHETWADMLRLQDSGIYPAAFRRIRVPVLMLHGKDDPHPGAMTAATLRRYVPQLDYVELSCCGHYPWLERRARERFLHLLAQWLVRGSPGMDALADPHIKDA
jgi:pimeloyl-ACP methyl ester carboxylesterase